ncbi:MAG TPA: TIGR03118 family protein, partial [Gemmatimonadaceae bacterium]|nr:TIGR03118 family protein [Gemmatimonadaceae bacterium]
MSYHIATRPLSRLPLLAALAATALASSAAHAQYAQTNLTSNIPGRAANTDPDLQNPWGISFGNTSPYWISDNGTGLTTLYNGLGVKSALVVTIPLPSGGPSAPTGQVFNNAGAFQLSNGSNASFLFATEDGTIAGWNGAAGTTAITMVDNSTNASYKGLAIAGSGTSARLYATNFRTGTVDVWDGSFNPVLGGFTDPLLPSGYAPFNVQNIGGNIVVTYAVVNPTTGDDVAGPGNGVVDVYDVNGNLLRR